MAEGVANQAAAIRRAVGRVMGGGARNVTTRNLRTLKSSKGAKRAGNLKTSKAGRATRTGLKSGALITGRQARRMKGR